MHKKHGEQLQRDMVGMNHVNRYWSVEAILFGEDPAYVWALRCKAMQALLMCRQTVRFCFELAPDPFANEHKSFALCQPRDWALALLLGVQRSCRSAQCASPMLLEDRGEESNVPKDILS